MLKILSFSIIKCRNFTNLLMVLRSSDNYILGGFTSKSWLRENVGHLIWDEAAFVFSIKESTGQCIRHNIVDSPFVIYTDWHHGPCFGETDLHTFFDMSGETTPIGRADPFSFSSSNDGWSYLKSEPKVFDIENLELFCVE